jgi:hypothetical protein
VVGELWIGNEDAERFPCDVCVEWAREYNELARREVDRLRLPDLMPYGLTGSNAHIASARFYATARRTICVLEFRRDSLATFGPEVGKELWILCLRMARTKDYREWAVWVKSTSDWLANELAMRSKKAWILYALNTWVQPHYRLRDHGRGHKWKRTELIPLLKSKNSGVRVIALELMTVASN